MRVVILDTEAGRLSVDYYGGLVMFHLVIRKWSAQRFKAYRKFFDAFLNTIKEEGYEAVYATPYEDDARAKKLISMFGFRSLGARRGLLVMQRRLTNA